MMNKLINPILLTVCLLFTACDADKILPGEVMVWSYDILTPEGIKWEKSSLGWTPEDYFRVNSKGGDMVMTCENYDSFSLASNKSDIYDCDWMTVKAEGNQLKFHFPYNDSGAPEASKHITVSAKDGKRTAKAIIHVARTFEKEEQPQPAPLP